MKRFFRRKRILIPAAGLAVFGIYFAVCLPDPLFRTPVSAVLLDHHGELMGAMIAGDGQWRFPYNPVVSKKFRAAIVQYEDKRFYDHPGVDVLALSRAARQNIRAGKVRSGGSTLTMQVIRLARKQDRTLWQKAVELIWALRLEWRYSKEDILALYASNAPFGSNVVGLDAAAWRYYNKSPEQLSWGETATLAVLPNSPALVHPGRNSAVLMRKRNALLEKLFRHGDIDSLTCHLAMSEPLPGKPFPLPQLAPHLMARSRQETNGEAAVTRSTLHKDLQLQVNQVLLRHHEALAGNGINNAAALIADVETGNVLAYAGNIFMPGRPEMETEVDVITAPRSTGSILKPVLYASMLNEGDILPNTLVPDIPTQIAGYSPQNFNRDYDGAVPACRALERSLNVPAVRLLRQYGIEKFNYMLKRAGMTTLNQPAGHYGLSIILGGAEGTMWDIGGIYASMARTLNHYGTYSGRYDKKDFHPLRYVSVMENEGKKDLMEKDAAGFLSSASIWCTFNAMEEVNRPDADANWKELLSSQRVAWKTGTSFGFRDGWAVGCTPKYVVVVWAGNADGEGRPGLTGIGTAAPILFDILKLLKPSPWFVQPYDEMERVPLCRESGHRASDICPDADSAWIPVTGLKTPPCPYHRLVHLDASGHYRVNSQCAPTASMQHVPWFVLPPAQEWFYKSRNATYKTLPPWRKDCGDPEAAAAMEFIYPKKSTQLYVPVELDGSKGNTVFEVAHRESDAVLYWHLDDNYLGMTKGYHQMALHPSTGKHTLTVVDEHGEQIVQRFEILSR